MDDDSQAIAIGLGAGLGGFAGLLIVACIVWHIFCGTWCDKKKVPSTIALIPIKQKQHISNDSPNKVPSTTTTVTSIKNPSPDLQSFSSAR